MYLGNLTTGNEICITIIIIFARDDVNLWFSLPGVYVFPTSVVDASAVRHFTLWVQAASISFSVSCKPSSNRYGEHMGSKLCASPFIFSLLDSLVSRNCDENSPHTDLWTETSRTKEKRGWGRPWILVISWTDIYQQWLLLFIFWTFPVYIWSWSLFGTTDSFSHTFYNY